MHRLFSPLVGPVSHRVKVKERMRQTGIIVNLSSDEGNCFTEGATTMIPKESSSMEFAQSSASSTEQDDSGYSGSTELLKLSL